MAEARTCRCRGCLLLLVALAALSSLQCVRADGDDIYTPGTSASIDLGSYHTDLAYADGAHRADISQYGIIYIQPAAPDVGFGLRGGYMTAGIDSAVLNPLGDGYGPFLGLFSCGNRCWGTTGAWMPGLPTPGMT